MLRPSQRASREPRVTLALRASFVGVLILVASLTAFARGQEVSHSETRLFHANGYTRVVARSLDGPAETAITVRGREIVARASSPAIAGAAVNAELLVEDVYVVYDARGRYRAYLVRNILCNENGITRADSQTTRLMFRPRPYRVILPPEPHPSFD